MLSQLPPQISNVGLELLDPLGLPHDEDRELLVGRTPISSHPTMIDKTGNKIN